MRVRVFKDGEYVKTFEVDVSAAELTPMEDKVFTAAEAQIEHGSIVYFADLYWKWDGGWWVNLAADNPAVAGLYAKAVAAETEPLRGVPMTPTSALQDNLARIFEAERVFGRAIINSDGKEVPVRYICEQHIKEDCGGRIPTVADWFRNIKRETWMAHGYRVEGEECENKPVQGG